MSHAIPTLKSLHLCLGRIKAEHGPAEERIGVFRAQRGRQGPRPVQRLIRKDDVVVHQQKVGERLIVRGFQDLDHPAPKAARATGILVGIDMEAAGAIIRQLK